jgi:hypothetical protein
VSLIILPGAKKSSEDWAFENGKEVCWYDENPVAKHIILTSPMSPRRHGYNRTKTSVPKEMDRIFSRLHEQEREANQRLVERIYCRGRAFYEAARGRLLQRLVSADSKAWEKAFIRESLRLMDERDSAMQKNTVYGVSGLETSEAPVQGARQKVMIENYKVDHDLDDHPILKSINKAMVN